MFGGLPIQNRDITRLGITGIRQRGLWMRGTGATSMSGTTGLYAGSVLTTDNTRNRGRNKFGAYYEAITSSVIGNNAGHVFNPTASNFTALELPGLHKFAFGFDRVTNIRAFIGLSATTILASGIDADNLSANSFGIQFSTDRGDTTFQLVSFNGSQTTTPTTITPVAARLYEVIFYWVESTTVFVELREYTNPGSYVVYTGKITTNLVTSTTDLTQNFGCESRSAATLSLFSYGVESYVLAL